MAKPSATKNKNAVTPVSKTLRRALPRSFFDRDPRIVARELLGKLLVRRLPSGALLAGRIVEAEAYLGVGDPGAHAASGVTARNAAIFGPPGHAYVYFIYGNHYCMNVSCLPDGVAGCVLLRALEPVAGVAEMCALRGLVLAPDASLAKLRNISSGPGRMAEALGITRALHNNADLTSARKSDLWIADDGYRPARIVATPRINVTKAAEHKLRYIIAGNEYVSGGGRMRE
jgi:DNA-3-methyladenine glycosylase